MTETKSINELAETVAGEYPNWPHAQGEVAIDHVDNPRVETYDHYYKVIHTALESLGLKPTLLSTTLIDHLFDVVERHRDRVDLAALMPTVKWAETTSELPRTGRELAPAPSLTMDDLADRRILVTGGSGFIGRQVVADLRGGRGSCAGRRSPAPPGSAGRDRARRHRRAGGPGRGLRRGL